LWVARRYVATWQLTEHAEERQVAIQTGDRIPDVKVFTFGANGPEATTSAEVLGHGKVALFAVPGAFTPTCSDHHLPGFVLRTEELKQKGVDKVVCVSVNDAFVMHAWGENQNVGSSVVMVADGNGEFTAAMGLTMDGSGFGLGSRSQRYAAILDDGVLTWLAVEPGPGLNASSVEEVLAAL
jgi:peroxiredoxin